MSVAIVGGGASGALVAVQLLRARLVPDVLLVQDSVTSGRGIAYATDWPQHLLNVPARNMSALPDDPDHFVRFLASPPRGVDTLGTPAAPETFAPRLVYGHYLEHLLDEAVAAAAKGGPRFTRVHDRIVDVDARAGGVVLTGADGRRFEAGRAVLATGFFAGRRWDLPGTHSNPWARGLVESLPLDAPILVLGTGLTMVDLALALEARGFRSVIHAVSRRGLLPNAHDLRAPQVASPPPPTLVTDAGELTAAIRRRVDDVVARGGNWRQATDSLRPYTAHLWRALPLDQQRRFLRHARPYWEVARHRMAPEVNARIGAMLAAGTIIAERARLVGLQADDDGVRAELRYPGGRVENRCYGAVIDGTGPNEDYRTLGDPLVNALRARGLARPHPLGIGWESAGDGGLFDAAGEVSSRLFTIGPPRRGDLWESTAIPEIRVQVRDLAERLGELAGLDCG